MSPRPCIFSCSTAFDLQRAREVESEAEQRHAEEREARLLGRMAAGASAEEESSDSEKEEETVHSLLLLLETLAHRSKKYARDELAWHEQHAQRQTSRTQRWAARQPERQP